MRRYVTDTHALLRYSGAGRGRLPQRVRRIFQQCEAGRAVIVVPVVVAWETALLVEDGVIALQPLGLPLITADSAITNSGLVPIIR